MPKPLSILIWISLLALASMLPTSLQAQAEYHSPQALVKPTYTIEEKEPPPPPPPRGCPETWRKIILNACKTVNKTKQDLAKETDPTVRNLLLTSLAQDRQMPTIKGIKP